MVWAILILVIVLLIGSLVLFLSWLNEDMQRRAKNNEIQQQHHKEMLAHIDRITSPRGPKA